MENATNKTSKNCNCSKTFGSCQCHDVTNVIIGPGNDDYGRRGEYTTSTFVFDPYHPKVAIDTQVFEDRIEITYVQRAWYEYATVNSSITIGSQQQVHYPDKVFKEIYGVKNNKLTLLQTIEGRVIPPQLKETYEFPE